MTHAHSRSRRPSLIILLLAIISPVAAGTPGSYFAVIVSDIEASAEWYGQTFGLTEQSRASATGKFEIVNLGKPGMFVELLQIATANSRPDGRTEGLFKAGLLVDDLHAFVTGLPSTEAAPEIVSDQRNQLLLIQLRDPDGNVIQVMELLDAESS